jgi:uncharacterized protein YndB with AHSA1/START domain
MSNGSFPSEDRDRIEIEIVYPHPVARVWHALTDAEALARWLMPNDFAPRLGHHFTFRAEGEWTGTIECEVVALEPPTRVAYTWASGPLRPPTLVTWMLASEGEGEGEGTRLRLVHSGFAACGPTGLTVRDILASGWDSKVLREKLPALLDALAAEVAGGRSR